MNYMTFVYVFFIWLMLMIAWNIYKGKKEKEQMIINKKGIQKYNEKYTK